MPSKSQVSWRRDINICQCFLILKEKYSIDSNKAKQYLSLEFFMSIDRVTRVLANRNESRDIALADNQKCLLLRKLEESSPKINPLHL